MPRELEKLYTPHDLAELWGFDRTTIQRWFHDEPGVFRHTDETNLGRKKVYVTLRIPQDVALRVYDRKCRR